MLMTEYCSLPSGPEGIRTPDLLSAIEARSQLRYRPNYFIPCIRGARRNVFYLRHLGMSMKNMEMTKYGTKKLTGQ